MPTFVVEVKIENKPGLSDPEGDTILNDLVLKESNSSIKSVKTAKMLKFIIAADNAELAKRNVQQVCDQLRIYNPLVSSVTFAVSEM